MGIDKEKVTDLDVQALIDKELTEEREIKVAERIKESPMFQKRFTELNHQNDLLKLWWATGKHST